jgi:hypothetical protein
MPRNETIERLEVELNKISAWCSKYEAPATVLPPHLNPDVLRWYAERVDELRSQYDGLKFSITKRYFDSVTDSLSSLRAFADEYGAVIEREDLRAARSILESVSKVCQTCADAIDRLRKSGL